MNEELTSKKYWSKYWKTKPKIEGLIIEKDFLFHDVLSKYVPKKQKINFLEIGGFPGQWAIFFAKYWGANSTLLDRYIDREVIQALSTTNAVKNINIIEGDVFDLSVNEKFDVVMSAGFIEHFSDVNSVIDKHIDYLEPNGTLILSVPNLLGLNGLLQKIIDKETYDTHFLETMDDQNLKRIVSSKNLDIEYINYYGKFCLWLEDVDDKPRWIRRLVYLTNIIGRFLVRFESRIFSPYLIVVAKNKKNIKDTKAK
jgi:2-polyprenyl-3-methyl-5-hydroxy-6-metoxy-1,4-benzoquinol methylase